MQIDLNISSLFRKEAIGLSIGFKGGKWHVSGVGMHFGAKEMNIIDVFDETDDVASIEGHLKPGMPLILILNGKGILEKTITETSYSSGNYLNEHFGQLDAREFYCQQHRMQGDGYCISVVRKSQLDEVVSYFLDRKIPVAGVYLGHPVLENVAGLVSDEGDFEITGLGRQLTFSEGKLLGMEVTSEDSHAKVNVDGFDLDTGQQLSLAASIQFFSPNPDLVPVECEDVDRSATGFSDNRKTGKMILVMAASLFLVLCVNTIWYLYLNDEVGEMRTVINRNEVYLQEAEEIRSDIKTKKLALNKMGMGERKIAVLSDRIASVVPHGIVLNELQIFPARKKKSKKEVPEFDFKAAQLTGTVKDYSDINTLIENLGDFKWVERARLIDFEKQDRGNTGLFSIEIELKP